MLVWLFIFLETCGIIMICLNLLRMHKYHHCDLMVLKQAQTSRGVLKTIKKNQDTLLEKANYKCISSILR